MKNKRTMQNKLTIGLFLTYLIVLTWIILLKMSFTLQELPHLRGINLLPFQGSAIVNGQILISEIINNILAFVPVGTYLCMLAPHWSFFQKVIPVFSLSLLYEILQFVFAIGASDITDLIGNTLGGILGILFYLIIYKLFKEKSNRVLSILASIATICLIALLTLLILLNR